MDHNQRIDAGEQYAKRRPEELIEKYKKIKQTLNHYDNLPTALKHCSLLSTPSLSSFYDPSIYQC